MTDLSTSRRPSAATLALAAAGLLALGAVGVRLMASQSSDEAPAPKADARAQQAASVDELIPQLQQRLREDPDNDAGWFNLGMLFREAGRFAEAERAFRRAMELQPRNANYVGYLAETLLLLGGRNPPPEAETLLRRALAIEPRNPQARYYLATLRDMRGDHRGALDELVTLLREAPPGAPWEPQVREAATTIARENDIAVRLPAAPEATPATAAIPGPTREQMEAARAIPPGQQDAMVKGMVDRLAGRLRENPRDADGWIRLMRSRMVLNEPQAAAEALRSALAAFQDDAPTQQRLRTAAQQLAVPGG